MNLQLSLKKNWFEMTKSGIKTEDYREITPYWASRLLTYEGKKQTQAFWDMMPILFDSETMYWHKNISFNNFDANTMTLGYPSKTDTERILKFEHAGIEIRKGSPEWGAELGKLYFVIKHGEKL
jgi:hypothetical protein